MKKNNDFIQLSASDLSNYLSCHHITELDKKVIAGEINKPEWNNPHVVVLQERGLQHEADYLKYLESQDLKVMRISEDVSPSEAFEFTLNAMKDGVDVIAQGVLRHEEWFGKADILRKVNGKSKLGEYSYEVFDTKLSRETKAGAILQLCLYSELLSQVTGIVPEKMYVVTPGETFNVLEYRVNDFQAYYRLVRNNLIKTMKDNFTTYPEPTNYCDVCKWFEVCDKQRRDDDHLCFVAGLASYQRKELEIIGISTLESLAKAEGNFYEQFKQGVDDSIIKAKEQARLQFDARISGKPKFEILEIQQGKGFNRLPEPCEEDVFFDLEGDQFYRNSSIEYLWGFSCFKSGELRYQHKWALDFQQEKESFEWFIDYVVDAKNRNPRMKVYHYSSYEPVALKRLMGRYGTKENEIDHLLRTETFVDLFSITKQAIRAGIESYSIKDLEQFYGFIRKVKLREVAQQKRMLEHSLELNRLDTITDDIKETVRIYNQDDTNSTFYLRNWLEELREIAIKKGEDISRPPVLEGEISQELDEQLKRLIELKQSLQNGISPDPDKRSLQDQAQWLLGDLIGFYRREDKVNYWEKYRLKDLDGSELLEDKSGISGLTYVGTVGGTSRCPIQRYCFVEQAVDVKKGNEVFKEGFLNDEVIKSFGTIEDVNYEESFIDIKMKTGHAEFHPNSIWAWQIFLKTDQAERLFELANFVLENGITSEDQRYRAARDILLRNNPKFKREINYKNDDTIIQLKEMALALDESYLAIQGPPGTGKSFSASQVVLTLAQKGFKIGITGLSHAVISNLINKIQEAGEREGIVLNINQKTKPELETNHFVNYVKKSDEARSLLDQHGGIILGGTDFMWSGKDFEDTVDYLVVDEAGQFSLVGIMSIAHVARNIILLGDGAQLKQPIQGAHPDGCEVSALDYIVGANKTLPPEKGVFLPITYRLHPNICAFISELFYESRLHAIDGNEKQIVTGNTRFSEKQLSIVEVDHFGNSNYSMEEVDAVKKIVNDLIKGDVFVTTVDGGEVRTETVNHSHIKIVAPYNAQVHRIKQVLPDVSVGTVDKFQGQETPILIFSTATSSPEDAPRGMEFLYSGNRLNVAVSRAQCLCIMVANPRIFEPDCKSPRQMQLANAYCRYKEMATKVEL